MRWDDLAAECRSSVAAAAADGAAVVFVEHFLLLAGTPPLPRLDGLLYLGPAAPGEAVRDACRERRVGRGAERTAEQAAALREYYDTAVWPAFLEHTAGPAAAALRGDLPHVARAVRLSPLDAAADVAAAAVAAVEAWLGGEGDGADGAAPGSADGADTDTGAPGSADAGGGAPAARPPPPPSREAEAFAADGYVVLDGVLPAALVAGARAAAAEAVAACEAALAARGLHPLGVGLKNGYDEMVQRSPHRYEMPLPGGGGGVCGPGTAARAALDARLLPLVREVLGPGARLAEASPSVVLSRPGATDQAWHADGPHRSAAEHLPAHCLNVFVPLVDLTPANGPTQFRPGSHVHTRDLARLTLLARIKKTLRPAAAPAPTAGGAVVFDYRVLHRGLANTSPADRPVLVLTYCAPWYRDVLNYPRRSLRGVNVAAQAGGTATQAAATGPGGDSAEL